MGLVGTAVAVATAVYLTDLYVTASQSGNSGNSFLFPYSSFEPKTIIKDVKDTSRNIYVTKISNENKYYFHGDYNAAVAINNEALIKNKGGILSNIVYRDIKKLNSGTVLANCVGYAHGRLNEIWDTAKKTNFIKYEDSTWKIPSKNNQEVTCGAEPSKNTVPAVNAYAWYDAWPTSDGWYKSGKFQDDIRPLPGAVMCWYNTDTASGTAGHVAVVEAVYNYGQPNEYVVASMSGYSLYGAKNIVWLQTIRRDEYANGTPYKFGAKYKFAGFLFSPVCQLLAEGSYFYTGKANYDDTQESRAALEADTSVYNQINAALAASGKKIYKDITQGQKVKITWFGSDKPDNGSKINLFGGEGVVVKVDKSAEYPYAVSLTGDNVITGYFKREALKAVEDVDE